MNTLGKIQIDSSLSALAKAHQELLAHFERNLPEAGNPAKAAVQESAGAPEHAAPARRPRRK